MADDFDVLVIGGGLVGASFACAMAGSGRRIGLVEAALPATDPVPDQVERTTALAWGSRILFERWGLWPAIAGTAAPIRHLHVSQRGRFGVTRVDHADYGVDALGYVVPNHVLAGALYQRLADVDGVEVIAPARFQQLETGEHRVAVTLSEGDRSRQITTCLVVGADGAGSAVRAALGIGAEIRDYGQQAVVTSVCPGRPPGDTAYERFTPAGPIAILPRSATDVALVWTLPTDEAEQRCREDDGAFLAALQTAFGQRLGRFDGLGPRGAYPLKRVICPRPIAERALLVGSAGHHLHPAAAQGFNLALRDVTVLAGLLQTAADPGDAALLETWREARRADQHRVSNFTDGIVRLFSNRLPGLGLARGLGLTGLELLPGIKHDMARRSMGLAFASDVTTDA
ncbi:FAD-dependent monooxygenase [Spectribacter hydrogenooxidans]|uniref:FAD-dependent monooxygenase n=1 Tax=Spectribacter hydrogenoxidans TaxID=3075608 RepID=A0ABU3BYH6_9GAMM|nr:FAD-dependent monooxygenase [Salinisphaera sp. W335]MDT0634176.1 FAD-dependent monooxygenase [Salinisphaera sp. W335]